GIIKGASTGRGLGKRILAVARSADIVLLVLDIFQPYHEDILTKELSNIGIKLNQNPPNIVIEKSTTGGIAVAEQVKLKKMSIKLLKDILNVYGYTSARVVIREDIDSEQLVDFITGNKTYAKSITLLNKIDLVDEKFLKKATKKIKSEFIPVSADANINIGELRDRIYDELRFIRIYLRPKGGKTDYKEPLIIRNGNSILDVCNKLHRKLKRDFRYGLVWGQSVKFAGQRVGLNHVLQDEDVLTIIKIR
nr:TGS domain-containing protein [Candidatus Neomarinimicrobiota bacterium]